MTNINDFIQWWEGFRSAIDPANITVEHLDIIGRKINGLVDLWDIQLPQEDNTEDNGWTPGTPWGREYGWPYIPPFHFPKITPEDKYPRVPDIWCQTEQRKYPRVGTPLGFGTLEN